MTALLRTQEHVRTSLVGSQACALANKSLLNEKGSNRERAGPAVQLHTGEPVPSRPTHRLHPNRKTPVGER